MTMKILGTSRLTAFLKAVNRLPFPVTVRHEQTFGEQTDHLKDQELDSPEAWDELRRANPQFSVSTDRAEWLKACNSEIKKDGQDGRIVERASAVANVLRANGIQRIFSVGVGGAGLEYHLKRLMPELKIVATEYAPENVELLRKVFIECDELRVFDILHGDWSEAIDPHLKTMVLMYRVDPHFTDAEWRGVFERMKRAGVKNILYIPCGFLTLKSFFQRRARARRWRTEGKKVVFAGYLRTRTQFLKYWKGLYVARSYDLGGFEGFALQSENDLLT